MGLTIKEISEALIKAEGIQADAAAALNVTRQAISKRVGESAQLTELVFHAQESLADYGEGVIRKALKGDDPKLALRAAMWVVARLRKERFSERQEITGADGKEFKVSVRLLGED